MMAGQTFHRLVNTIPDHQPFNLKRFVYCVIRDFDEVELQGVTEVKIEAVDRDLTSQTVENLSLATLLRRVEVDA